MLLKDKDDPKSANLRTDIAAPSLPKLRSERDAPRSVLETTDREKTEPTREIPTMDSELPKRT